MKTKTKKKPKAEQCCKKVICSPLNDLGNEILDINIANGWDVTNYQDFNAELPQGYKIPAKLALITSEISEALEAYRKKDRENFEEEMADALIRILDTAGGMGIDMDYAVAKKLEVNRTRGYRHGGKKV